MATRDRHFNDIGILPIIRQNILILLKSLELLYKSTLDFVYEAWPWLMLASVSCRFDEICVVVLHLNLNSALWHFVEEFIEKNMHLFTQNCISIEMCNHLNKVKDVQITISWDSHEIVNKFSQCFIPCLFLIPLSELSLGRCLRIHHYFFLRPNYHKALKKLEVIHYMRVRWMIGHVFEKHSGEEIVLYSKDFVQIFAQRFESDVLLGLFFLWWSWFIKYRLVNCSESIEERKDIYQEIFFNLFFQIFKRFTRCIETLNFLFWIKQVLNLLN